MPANLAKQRGDEFTAFVLFSPRRPARRWIYPPVDVVDVVLVSPAGEAFVKHTPDEIVEVVMFSARCWMANGLGEPFAGWWGD
jgi:hypothetical protein